MFDHNIYHSPLSYLSRIQATIYGCLSLSLFFLSISCSMDNDGGGCDDDDDDLF